MIQTAIALTVACYAVLGALLLSLNITSLWRWWVKVAAIVLTVVACVGSYFSISGLLGWPAQAGMPERFNLVSTRIVEPDMLRGTEGRIYLWIEQVDENQVIISPPRAFEVPYEVDLSIQVAEAQSELKGGAARRFGHRRFLRRNRCGDLQRRGRHVRRYHPGQHPDFLGHAAGRPAQQAGTIGLMPSPSGCSARRSIAPNV